jgi:TolB protein
MQKLLLFIALLVSLFIYTVIPFEGLAKVYIDIFSPSATRFPIAIPNFKNTGSQPDQENLSEKMANTIRQDLETSGFFRILSPEALSAVIAGDPLTAGLTGDKIQWDSWSIIGTEALVAAGFSLNGPDLITELRLFDIVQRQFLTGKRYFGKVQDYRLIAHKFSNKIFQKLTDEKGIFESRIAFVTSLEGKKDIFVMDYDGANVQRITNYKSLTLSPAWSPDGRTIAFTSYKDGNPDLYMKDIISGEVEKISRKRGINIAPAWSPDGERIALTLSLDNGNSEIYVLHVKDKQLVRLTRDWATDVSPTWSPDGEKIAFVSDRSGNPHIYWLELKSGKIKRLTFEGGYNTSPVWSPRGDSIAYTGRKGGKFNIFAISLDGRQLLQFTSNAGSNEDPSWSPDGRHLTFSSNRTGQKEIFIMRADGSGQQRITSGQGAKSSPAWSPYLSEE